MKTILDHHGFMKRLKLHCAEERIELFYAKACIAKILSPIRRPKVYLSGDLGDEVYDAIYATITDLGLLQTMNLSPYDVVEMKPVYKDIMTESDKVKKYVGMTVTFKDLDAKTFVKDGKKDGVQ